MKAIVLMHKKIHLNLKILRFFFLTPILFSLPIFYLIGDAKAGLEFQWDQNSGYRRLKWFQKESRKNLNKFNVLSKCYNSAIKNCNLYKF